MSKRILKCRHSFLNFNRLYNGRKNNASKKTKVTTKSTMPLNRKISKIGTTSMNRNNKRKNLMETRKLAIDLKVR